MAVSALDYHLDICVQCAAWLDEATRLTRLARVTRVEVPDLSESIVASVVLPAGRVLRRRRQLRWLLALVGVIQLGIAAPDLFGDSIGMAMSTHAAHEAAAWNAALGIALLATALQPKRAAGVLTVVGTFVGVLALLSIRDVASGAVDATRLISHGGAVVGLVLVVALTRAERALPTPGDGATGDATGRGSSGGLRGVA